jgi:hypothetical protein
MLMNKYFKNISAAGLVPALLFLLLSLFIFSFETDGQGGVLTLFVTFPWFFIGMDTLPLWLGIIPNTIIVYFAGLFAARLVKKIYLFVRRTIAST